MSARRLRPAVFARLAPRIDLCGARRRHEARGWPDLQPKLLARGEDRPRVFYLATSPDLFGPICEGRCGGPHDPTDAGGAREADRPRPRLRDPDQRPGRPRLRASRRSTGSTTTSARRSVQNLMALRFANSLFEPLWNRAAHRPRPDHGRRDVGVEGRGGYYDKSGALRDMVQNHLLQLLCLVAMEPPTSMAGRRGARREAQGAALAAADRPTAMSPRKTVRGQYRAGASGGVAVPGYAEELGRTPARHRDLRRAQGRDRQLALGRRAVLPAHRQAHAARRLGDRDPVQPVPHSIFAAGAGPIAPNRLVIRLQPDEGIQLDLMSQGSGPGRHAAAHAPLDISFAEPSRCATRMPTSAC